MKTAKPSPAKKPRTAGRKLPESEKLPIRQLKLVGVVALLFGIVTAVVVSWELMFPVPPEHLVEVAWTHECRCAHDWIKSLREQKFVVRDHEIDDLSATRRQWQVPDAARGCHPARYLGYVLDGHVTAKTLRRLARERPPAFGIVQIEAPAVVGNSPAASEQPQFELIDRDGTRRPWM